MLLSGTEDVLPVTFPLSPKGDQAPGEGMKSFTRIVDVEFKLFFPLFPCLEVYPVQLCMPSWACRNDSAALQSSASSRENFFTQLLPACFWRPWVSCQLLQAIKGFVSRCMKRLNSILILSWHSSEVSASPQHESSNAAN